MARIAARVERPIKLHRMEGRIRDQIAVVEAFNLPDAIRRWYDSVKDEQRYHAPLFQANTVTLLTEDDAQEVYVATD